MCCVDTFFGRENTLERFSVVVELVEHKPNTVKYVAVCKYKGVVFWSYSLVIVALTELGPRKETKIKQRSFFCKSNCFSEGCTVNQNSNFSSEN